jgi:hypothetical protein
MRVNFTRNCVIFTPDDFPTPHIGHSRHGFFLQDWIVNPMLNLLKRTMTYPTFEPGTFEEAVSIPNHYTIEVIKTLPTSLFSEKAM